MLRCVTTILLCIGLSCPFAVCCFAAPPSQTLLPESTAFFISAGDLGQLRSHWEKTQFHQLLSDDETTSFRDEVVRWHKELLSDLEQSAATWVEQFAEVTSGELAAALVELPSGAPSLVLLADVSTRMEDGRRLLQDAAWQFKRRRIDPRSVPHAEGQLIVFELPQRNTYPGEAAFFLTPSGLLGVTTSIESAQQMLDRAAAPPGDACLANETAFQTIISRCESDLPEQRVDLRWFINPIRLVRLQHQITSEESYRRISKFLEQHGFDAVRGVGGVISLATADHDVDFRTSLYAPGPYRQSMQMLDLGTSNLAAKSRWASPKSSFLTSANVDLLQVFDHCGMLFDDIVAQGIEGTFGDVIRDVEDETGVELRNGFIRYLKPQVTVAAEEGELLVTIPIVADGEEQVSVALTGLFRDDPEIRRVRFEGLKNDLWTVEGFAAVVADQHLILATDDRLIRAALKRGDADLTVSPDYQRVQQELTQSDPDDFGLQLFARLDLHILRKFQQMQARRASGAEPIWYERALDAAARAVGCRANQVPAFDAKKLPESAVLLRHLGLVGLHGRPLADGWLLSGFVLPRTK